MRIVTNDANSMHSLSVKFGAKRSEWKNLILKCKELELNLVGVAFHVGSGARDLQQFVDSFNDSSLGFWIIFHVILVHCINEMQIKMLIIRIPALRIIFDMAETEGIKMNMLDIGGGFPGADNHFFEQIADVINQQIEKHFPQNVKIIAEPGRFLVASCLTIVTRVISARKEADYMNYYTNEGVYGAFNYIHFDTRSCRPEVLIQFETNEKIVSINLLTFSK